MAAGPARSRNGRPLVADGTPALPGGYRNVEGWYGAFLEAEAFQTQRQVDAFLRASFDHPVEAAGGF